MTEGIPPRAFSIWYQGADAAPPSIRRAFASNARAARASGWTFDVYDADGLRDAARQCGVLEAYDAYDHMHQRIDLGRLCLLYLHGGVSVDADQTFVKPCGRLPLLRSTVPVFSEVACRRRTLLDRMCHRVVSLGARRAVNNAMIMSPERSPTMLHIARTVAARPRLRLGNSMLEVLSTTGPVSVSHAVSDLIEAGHVRLIPATVVEPCSLRFQDVVSQALLGIKGKCTRFKNTVVVHPYTMSWFSAKGNVTMLLACVLCACACSVALRRRR